MLDIIPSDLAHKSLLKHLKSCIVIMTIYVKTKTMPRYVDQKARPFSEPCTFFGHEMKLAVFCPSEAV